MAVVSEGQHFTTAPLTGDRVCQIIRHHRVADAEQFDQPLVRFSRQHGMIVQVLPRH